MQVRSMGPISEVDMVSEPRCLPLLPLLSGAGMARIERVRKDAASRGREKEEEGGIHKETVVEKGRREGRAFKSVLWKEGRRGGGREEGN